MKLNDLNSNNTLSLVDSNNINFYYFFLIYCIKKYQIEFNQLFDNFLF